MNPGTATIIRGNARSLPLADDTVDLIVTSPPYFALRSYQDGGEHYAGQIGDEPTPAEFVDSLLEVTRECVRVLKPSGSLWVNLGDKYVADNRGSGIDIKRGDAKHAPRGPAGYITGGMRQKSLMGIPWRYALACIDDLGLILRAEVVLDKKNGLPESVTDRVRRSHEQLFHFTLQPRYFSAVDEIREPHRSEPGREGRGALGGQKTIRPVGPNSGSYNALGALPGSVWPYVSEPFRAPDHLGIDHFAAFASALPKRIIQGWSPAGVCVECGEGRRPVTERAVPSDFGRRDEGRNRQRKGEGPPGNGLNVQPTTITGYTCRCIEEQTWNATNAQKRNSTGSNSQRVGHFSSGSDSCASATKHASVSTQTSTETTRFSHPPTRPAVVLDPFGGTGTTAMVAKALGRHGISIDMSSDYCRLGQWRTNDRNQLAKVVGIDKADPVHPDQLDLFGEIA